MALELSVSSTHSHRKSKPSMMIRLLRFALKLSVALALSGWLAIRWGHSQPIVNTATAMGLSWCEDMPCFKSIVPGRTRWTAKLAEFSRQLMTQADPYHLSLSASDNGRFLGAIIVPLPAAANVTVSDIVQLYGVPCRVDVVLYTRWNNVTLWYPRLIVQISRIEYALSPNTLVQRVTLTDPTTNMADPCAFNSLTNSVTQVATIQRRWHGFTSLQHYLMDSP